MTCKRGNTDHDMNKTYTLAERMEQTATRINSLSGCHLDLHTPRCSAIMQTGRHDKQEMEYRSRHEQNIHACRKNGTNSHKNQLTEWLPSRSTDSEMHRYQPGRHDMQEREYRSRHEQNIHACRKNGTNSHKNQLTEWLPSRSTHSEMHRYQPGRHDMQEREYRSRHEQNIHACRKNGTNSHKNQLTEWLPSRSTDSEMHRYQPGRHDMQERKHRSRHEQNIQACRKNGTNSHKNQLTEWLPSRSTDSKMHRYHAERQT